MRPYNQRVALGFTFVAATFAVFAVGNIFTVMAVNLRDPGPPPALNYRPVPPSCCGDSVCSMENHHD